MKNVFQHLLRLGHDEDFQPHIDQRFTPTDAPIGSQEKIAVLAHRAQLGLPLWHPQDRSASSLPDEVCIRFFKEVLLAQRSRSWIREESVK